MLIDSKLKTSIINFILVLFLIISPSIAKAGLLFDNGGEKIIKVYQLPETPVFSSDGEHYDIGYVYKRFRIFWIPLWNYDGRWCGYITSNKDKYLILSKSDLDRISQKASITIPDEPKLDPYDVWGGKLIIVLFFSFFSIFATASMSRDEEEKSDSQTSIFEEFDKLNAKQKQLAILVLISFIAVCGYFIFLNDNKDSSPSPAISNDTTQNIQVAEQGNIENVEKETAASVEQQVFTVGDSFVSPTFEFKVISSELRDTVGQSFISSDAAEGAIYVAIKWSYKNISKTPVKFTHHPEIHLISSDGTVYSKDIGATSSYASDVDVNTKFISDINPQILIKSAAVFEVSKDLFDPKTWKIIVQDKDTQTQVLFN